jgi:hypothetical protein
MADTPETTPAGDPASEAPSEQAPLDLVPSFAVEDEKAEAWSPLTRANSDYERLWSMPNGSTHQKFAAAAEPSPPPPEPVAAVPEAPAPVTEAPEPEALEPVPEPESTPKLSAAASPPPTPGFTGTLVTGSEVLNSSIVVGSAGIVLWGGGAEIGTWEHSQAKIARLTFSRFAIQAEGETLTFTADDPSGLDNAIAAATTAQEPPTGAEGSVEDQPPDNEAEAPQSPTESVTPEVSVAAAAVRRPRIKNFR